MNSSNGQTERKRKVSPSTSSSSMDSSDDESTQLRRSVRKSSGKVSRISIFSPAKHHYSQKNSSSSETDSEEEKCPICLRVLKNQILAVTDTCMYHTFCLSCLEEWSKTKRTCPVDRKKYQSILVLDSKKKVSKELHLKSLPVASNLTCEICGYLDRQEAMLVCFGCNLSFHSFCVPHSNEPPELWLCNECCYYYNN